MAMTNGHSRAQSNLLSHGRNRGQDQEALDMGVIVALNFMGFEHNMIPHPH